MEETYLNIFLSPSELNTDIKKLIKNKLNERYLFREIDGRMITDLEIKNLQNIPLSKSSINSIEVDIPVKINYKTYKAGDIIYGQLFQHENDTRSFVIGSDIICEILNTDILSRIKSDNHIKIQLQNIKSTNGCFYFIAQGYIIL